MPRVVVRDGVTYKEVPSFPGFFAGTDGTVWTSWVKSMRGIRKNGWRQIKGSDSHGYLDTNIKVPGQEKAHIRLHCLVAEAFHGPCPPGKQCRHKNGCRTDNRPDNLAWGTQSENEQDKKLYGKFNHITLRGSDSGSAILSERDVQEIVRHINAGMPHEDIAGKYGVTKSAIGGISTGRTWGWFTGIKTVNKRKLDLNKAREIRQLFASGETRVNLANRFGVSRSMIEGIVNNIRYREAA